MAIAVQTCTSASGLETTPQRVKDERCVIKLKAREVSAKGLGVRCRPLSILVGFEVEKKMGLAPNGEVSHALFAASAQKNWTQWDRRRDADVIRLLPPSSLAVRFRRALALTSAPSSEFSMLIHGIPFS
jgi:hypothetical protein